MLFSRTIAVLICVMTGISFARAHEEPPKTIRERMEREHHRKQTAAAHLKSETVWKVSGSTRIRLLFTRFDRSGNALEETVFADDGSVSMRSVYSYTDEHVRFQQVAFTAADTERTAFTFIAPRLIATATDFAPTGYARSRLEYAYSESEINAVKYDSLDAVLYRIRYFYPDGMEKGLMTGARQEDAEGNQTLRIVNIYEGERRTEKQVFNARDSLAHTFLYSYTADGEFDTIVKRMADGTTAFRRLYRYEPDGILGSVAEYDAGGVLRQTLEYVYERFD